MPANFKKTIGLSAIFLLAGLVFCGFLNSRTSAQTAHSQQISATAKTTGTGLAKNPLAVNNLPDWEEIVPAFEFQRAADIVSSPEDSRFGWPVGGDQGAMVYNAQKFMAMNKLRGGKHLGEDFNGVGGMDTDLGDPVFAIANGRVLFAGQAAEGWGNVVILGHRMPNGFYYQSLYGHLDKIFAKTGTTLARGEELGTLGTGNNYYPAHLHFEISQSVFNEAGLPGYSASGSSMNRFAAESLLPKAQ